MTYKIPEIRFHPFDKEWEIRKFTDIVKRVSDKSNAAILPRVEFEDIVSNEGRLKTDFTNKVGGRKGIHFYPGYILYGKLRPYLNNWLFPNFEGIALGDFWVFKTLHGIPAFNYYLIQTNKYQKVANISSGTKMPRSDWGTVSSTQFYIPGTTEEQFKISEFLKHIDELIEHNQHALHLLKQRKKAFLQKMFPKKGESLPEIRFSGFENEWKKKKVGEYLNSFSNKTYIEDQYEMLSSTTNGLERRSGRVNGKSNKGYQIIEKGDLVLSPQNLWLGNINYNENFDIGMVSPSYKTFKFENINHLFFSRLLRLPKMFYEYERS
ncbi:MAG: restriction endonuclease subunit S, partial [Alkalibacterium sp.]|nr:restriction endonuclease subunit S [Alkalibacterium sp.]